MKHKIWLLQLPFVALFTFLFAVTELGIHGDLDHPFLRDRLFPSLRTFSGWVTNKKFWVRGPEVPKNKILIVEVDDDAISMFGRWPWHRDVTAALIARAFNSGAKVVGTDIVFSEPDQRIPDELADILRDRGLADQIDRFETDFRLYSVIRQTKDRLVLGWMAIDACQPAYGSTAACPIREGAQAHFPNIPEDRVTDFRANFQKFAYTDVKYAPSFNPASTPLISGLSIISNYTEFEHAAAHIGYFNVWPDLDGYIRRTNLAMLVDGKPHPQLALEMARVALDEDLSLSFDSRGRIASLGFSKSGRRIPVSPLGAMEVNFRGPSYTYQYVRASELLGAGEDESLITIQYAPNASKIPGLEFIETVRKADRMLASVQSEPDHDSIPADSLPEGVGRVNRFDLFRDAIVLIGVSAKGAFDMRAFPFDHNTPGVEGHANILDNLLAGDMLSHGSRKSSGIWILLLMTIGALLLAYGAERLESVPALLLFVLALGGFSYFDFKILFSQHHVDWITGFFYAEMAAIFAFTVAIKYVAEERNKKFIKGAFAKYVAPAIVDSIIKDPSKLTVGGEKKDLTILFSDIRGFTTFSERMDAKALAKFLNDYLGLMTDVVFETGGTLDKYIGDAVMAFWGAPLEQGEHAANACRAAIRMQQVLAEHHSRFTQQYGVDVQIGIGINSGPVNVGNMGSERIFEYTVIGDHVNLASRLEGLTKHYGVKIVTTRFTFEAIEQAGQPLPPHRVLDLVKVKGKKNAVELIQVLERELPPEALEMFEEGRKLYASRQWDLAMEKFVAAGTAIRSATGENDAPSEMYVERCMELKQTAPSADWDGSWEMHSK